MALGAFGLTTNGAASDLAITAATPIAGVTCNPVTGLTGMQSLTVSLRFVWGSGGSAVKVYLQTSLDGGNTWIDIACVVFNVASEHAVLNFSALTPKIAPVTPSDGAMADDTAVDGVLGDRVRVKAISIGTYAGNTALVGRMVAH